MMTFTFKSKSSIEGRKLEIIKLYEYLGTFKDEFESKNVIVTIDITAKTVFKRYTFTAAGEIGVLLERFAKYKRGI